MLTRFREFFREPEAVFWAVLFPVLLAAGLGVAFRERPADVLTVATSSPSVARALATERASRSKHCRLSGPPRPCETDALRSWSRERGRTVPWCSGSTTPIQKGARPACWPTARCSARAARDPVAVQDDLMREPGSRYIDFLIPGLVGLGIMSNAVWGIGFSIVDCTPAKLTKRLVATPMSRSDYLLSYLVWRMALLVLEVGIPVGLRCLCLRRARARQPRGTGAALRLRVAVFQLHGPPDRQRARTIEAVSGLMNLLQVPMWILSGVFFSSQRFPASVQPLIEALPLTALIDALRLHMLQGAGLLQLLPQLGVLAAWLVVCFTLALKLFRWR